ncbi:MAG TPA: RNA methyltransferase [Microvirga sp.]|jgi:tRNA G18 (ribose-2'-O)-methylase SpoU
MPLLITDPDDPRIEPYRAVRERDVVGRAERFIAEGEVVLRVLLNQSRFEVESLLLAENRLDTLAGCLERMPAGVPVYTAGRAVMDAIVGFPIHRGVLAAGRRRALPDAAHMLAALPEQALVVGLVGLANHDNVGGIFRNAAGFGADAVLLDGATCDPLYRKAIRVSVGGSLIVPFTRLADGTRMAEALADAGFEVLALSPAGRETLTAIRPARRTALLLGAEGPGLPGEILARCRTVSIPMAGGFDSLNVATTSGIVLHHLRNAPPRSS